MSGEFQKTPPGAVLRRNGERWEGEAAPQTLPFTGPKHSRAGENSTPEAKGFIHARVILSHKVTAQ